VDNELTRWLGVALTSGVTSGVIVAVAQEWLRRGTRAPGSGVPSRIDHAAGEGVKPSTTRSRSGKRA
jgi:hypothetical protein